MSNRHENAVSEGFHACHSGVETPLIYKGKNCNPYPLSKGVNVLAHRECKAKYCAAVWIELSV